MNRLIARFIFLLALVFSGALAVAQSKPMDQHWIAVFEQSYGTEGLYVIELFPKDAGGNARLNLQALNGAARECALKFPDEKITFKALEEKKLLPKLLDSTGDSYSYDEGKKMFTSSVGKDHSSLFGTALLINGNRAIRMRLVAPDVYTRTRWKKIYQDPAAPPALKNEIALREFMMEEYNNAESEKAERISHILKEVKIAAELYAVNHAMIPGDEITVETLMKAGLLNAMEQLPAEASVEYRKLGAEPTATFGEFKITTDPKTVDVVRKKYATEAFQRYGRYPPALALMARFEEPDEAVKLLGEAIKQWPDVPGLRVERMTHESRRRNFKAWDEDLDAILSKFPAAPLITEIQIAAESARLQLDKDFEARVAVTLADVRPDLLTQQLYALEILKKSSDTTNNAQRIYDRLLFANPAWRFVVPSPAAARAEKNPTDSP